MNWLARTFNYSVGRKILMALTGLFLVTFLIVHVSGNFLLFKGDNGVAFEEYSHFMTSNPIIRIIEIGTFVGFFIHAIDGFILWAGNRKARPVRYVKDDTNNDTLWTSRNMIISGSIILLFLIIHLKQFFIPYRFGLSTHTLFEVTREVFHNPIWSGFYILSMVLLALHLHHGFASGFQTLGLRHPDYYALVKGLGVLLSVVICGGFAAMPIYFLINDYLN